MSQRMERVTMEGEGYFRVGFVFVLELLDLYRYSLHTSKSDVRKQKDRLQRNNLPSELNRDSLSALYDVDEIEVKSDTQECQCGLESVPGNGVSQMGQAAPLSFSASPPKCQALGKAQASRSCFSFTCSCACATTGRYLTLMPFSGLTTTMPTCSGWWVCSRSHSKLATSAATTRRSSALAKRSPVQPLGPLRKVSIP
jgi:hypothetical protein